jgi:pre-mRNA-splicing factor CWC26
LVDIEEVKQKDDEKEEVDETQVRVRKPTAVEVEKKKRQEERKQQYMQWGKGLAQKKELEDKLSFDLKEVEKPLARYIDDKDLDKQLREQDRVGKCHTQQLSRY